jgi:hypothetical protein
MIYSNDRIDINIVLLKSHIPKTITTVQNAGMCIIFVSYSNFTIKDNVQTITLIAFSNNILILLKMFDGCGMIELCQVVLTQMAEDYWAWRTVSIFLGRCGLYSLGRLPLKQFHDGAPLENTSVDR